MKPNRVTVASSDILLLNKILFYFLLRRELYVGRGAFDVALAPYEINIIIIIIIIIIIQLWHDNLNFSLFSVHTIILLLILILISGHK